MTLAELDIKKDKELYLSIAEQLQANRDDSAAMPAEGEEIVVNLEGQKLFFRSI